MYHFRLWHSWTCRSLSDGEFACAPSWDVAAFPAAGLVSLWGKARSRFSGCHTWVGCYGSSAPLSVTSRSFHRIPHNSSRLVRKPTHIPAGIVSERTGRRKRAKGSRILNHTLHVSQPDVQRESCGVCWHSFHFEGPFPWCIRNSF